KVNQQIVEVGSEVGGMIVIKEGLKEGDVIVSDGIMKLRPGAVVQPAKGTDSTVTTTPNNEFLLIISKYYDLRNIYKTTGHGHRYIDTDCIGGHHCPNGVADQSISNHCPSYCYCILELYRC